MAPATTSTTRPAARHASRKVQSHSFRPRYPLDPFEGTKRSSPWLLNVEALLSTAFHAPRHVVLVLGAPSASDLDSLLQSHDLSQSLVILATHAPPVVSSDILPALRILRLSRPLVNEDASAGSFVDVLEWAEHVARVWRRYGGSGIAELSGKDDGRGSLLLVHRSSSTPTRPTSMTETQSISRARSDRARRFLRARPLVLPPVDPSQRAFDAIINFLPEGVPDKILLKQTIFVTGVAHPFLTPKPGPLRSPSPSLLTPSCPSTPSSVRSNKRRSFVFGALSAAGNRSSIFASQPRTPADSISDVHSAPPPPAHLVHLLPSAPQSGTRCEKLTENIESFLLSFAYPASPNPQAPERARPYVMGAPTFGTALRVSAAGLGTEPSTGASGCSASPDDGRWTVADAILCGALDGEPAGRRDTLAARWGVAPRAWIADAQDLVFMHPASPSPGGDIVPPPPAHVHVPRAEAQTVLEGPSLSARRKGKQRAGELAEDMSLEIPRSRSLNDFAGECEESSPVAPSEFSATAVCGMPYSPIVTPPDSDESGVESSSSSSVVVSERENAKSVSRIRVGWKFWRVQA